MNEEAPELLRLPRVPRLPLARLRVVLRARQAGPLPPYLGSTFRGVFGHVFKRIGCALPRQAQCRDRCQAPPHCAYSYVFETPVPPEVRGRLGSQFASHPFVLFPQERLDGGVVEGQPLSFSMTLLGRGIGYFPFLLAAFEAMAAQGLGKDRLKFELVEVSDSFDGRGSPLFDCRARRVLGMPEIHDLRRLAEHATAEALEGPDSLWDVRVRYLSPTHLVRDGDAVRQPDMDLLMAAAHRRLEALTLLHGEGPAAWDEADIPHPPEGSPTLWRHAPVTVAGDDPPGPLPLVHWEWDGASSLAVGDSVALRIAVEEVVQSGAGSRWDVWERRSNRQRTQVPMAGTVGDIDYHGVPAGCLPWLAAGQWIHLGKSTAFGMGRYVMEARRSPGA